MPTEVNGNNILLGRGKIYFDRFDASGNKTGEFMLGNCPTFEITGSAEEIEKFSSATAAAPLIASDVTRTSLAVRIVGDEFDKEQLAMALFGDTSTLSESTAGVTDEVIGGTPAAGVLQGRFYKLAHRVVSAVVVTSNPAGTTYTVATDYTVDAVSGRIYIVPGGTIADGTDLLVDYTYGTIALPTIRGMNQTTIKGLIRFIGDPARGPKYEVEIWRASVKADGAIGFIADDYAQWTLSGKIEADATNHPNEPHFRMIKLN